MRTSGHCGARGWRKSSYSGGTENAECVEIAVRPELVGVRDSKNTAGPQLVFPNEAWRTFLSTTN